MKERVCYVSGDLIERKRREERRACRLYDRYIYIYIFFFVVVVLGGSESRAELEQIIYRKKKIKEGEGRGGRKGGKKRLSRIK